MLKIKSINLPKLTKLTIHRTLGTQLQDKNILNKIILEMEYITGQKPLIIKAKKSVANFKLRKGVPISVKVNLQKKRLFIFLEKLYHLILPQVPDFNGLNSNSFDNDGNFTLGLETQKLFPELLNPIYENQSGFDLAFSIKTQQISSRRFLELFGFFFVKYDRT